MEAEERGEKRKRTGRVPPLFMNPRYAAGHKKTVSKGIDHYNTV